jgi:lipopolysaccharide export system permease protein
MIKLNTITHRYIFRELVPPFGISILFLTFVFLMTKILEITNLIVNYRLGLWDVVRMLAFSMPFFLQFVLPMSVMMAVLLTFLRMSSDNEVLALKSGGVSLYGMLPPVMGFSLLAGLMTAVTALYGLPAGRMAMKQLVFRVASTSIDIGLKPRTFNDWFDGVTIYINGIDPKTRALIDVFIDDQRAKDVVSTVVAPKGELISDPDRHTFRLRLYNGTINQVDAEHRTAYTIRFDSYDLSLDARKTMEAAQNIAPEKAEEMTFGQLSRYLNTATTKNKRYYKILLEFHKKFSMPFACVAMGLLAMPLGIHSKSAKRSYGVSLGLMFFLIYYMLLSAGWVFGEDGLYPPLIGMWVPNLVMGGIGWLLLIRAARERPVALLSLSAWRNRLTWPWIGRRPLP